MWSTLHRNTLLSFVIVTRKFIRDFNFSDFFYGFNMGLQKFIAIYN